MSDDEDPRALERVLAYDAAFVPRYAQRFGRHLLEALDVGPKANILDLGCRTGYPAVEVLERWDDARVMALDVSSHHLELARARAGADLGRRVFFKHGEAAPLRFDDAVFTHVVGNLIDRLEVPREALFREAARVLAPRGQLVVTLALRGSFIEVIDLFREIALGRDFLGVSERADRYAHDFPTEEMLRAEAERSGLTDVLVESWEFTLDYASSEALMGDAAIETAAMAEWRWCAAGAPHPEAVLRALRTAVDTYFERRTFELTVVGACVSARRPD